MAWRSAAGPKSVSMCVYVRARVPKINRAEIHVRRVSAVGSAFKVAHIRALRFFFAEKANPMDVECDCLKI